VTAWSALSGGSRQLLRPGAMRRSAIPALECLHEHALFGIAERLGHVRQRQAGVGDQRQRLRLTPLRRIRKLSPSAGGRRCRLRGGGIRRLSATRSSVPSPKSISRAISARTSSGVPPPISARAAARYFLISAW
jgi:hypothetical protein